MEKPCATLVILGLKSRVAKINYYKWILFDFEKSMSSVNVIQWRMFCRLVGLCH